MNPERRVRDVMTVGVVGVGPDTSFKEIVQRLTANNISAVPVLDEDGRAVGMVSEADLLSKERELTSGHGGAWIELERIERERGKAHGVVARELMSAPAITVEPQAAVALAARRMHDRGVKRLVVVDESGLVVGIVSRKDLLKVYDVPDHELLEAVMAAYRLPAFWIDIAGVHVGVADGVVTLDGEVLRHSDVYVLVGLARGVPGVVGVVDALSYRTDDVGGRTGAAAR